MPSAAQFLGRSEQSTRSLTDFSNIIFYNELRRKWSPQNLDGNATTPKGDQRTIFSMFWDMPTAAEEGV
jgi:hypothetical protein